MTPDLFDMLSKLTRKEWLRVKKCVDVAFDAEFNKIFEEAKKNAPDTCGASGARLYGDYAERSAVAERWPL